jgi:hypothetical protein
VLSETDRRVLVQARAILNRDGEVLVTPWIAYLLLKGSSGVRVVAQGGGLIWIGLKPVTTVVEQEDNPNDAGTNQTE